MLKFLNIGKLKHYLKIKNYKIENSRNGFTLIELLIVLALTAILATVAVISIGNYRVSNDLQRTGEEVTASLRNTRHRSMSQENGTRWGMRFSNSSGGQTYTSFGGTSYASSTSKNAYTLGNGIIFGNPPTSTSVDVLFDPISGNPSQNQIISLVDGRRDGLVYDVAVNAFGSVEGRFWQGLVGYWPLDEGTGTTAYDASGYGNNGILYSSSTICANPPTANCPAWQTSSSCKTGSCLKFGGGSDYDFIQLNNLPVNASANAENTVAFWMYWTGTSGDMPFGFSSDDLEFSSTFGFNTGCGDVYGMSTTNLFNNWVYVTAVFHNSSSTQSRLYINGVQQSLSLSGSPCSRSATANARIAYWPNNGNYNFGGSIDDVRIYNRALSSQEIQDLYNETQ